MMDTGIRLNDESIQRAGLLSPLCLTPETPLRDALLVLRSQHRGAVLSCNDDRLVGIFTERDVVRVLVEGCDLNTPIGEQMVPEPTTIGEGDSVAVAIRQMARNGYRRLPVVDDSHRPVGLVEVEGIVHFLVQDFPEAVYNLPPVANPSTREREGP
ncbi:MAG: CBS domain-containing protein [Thermoguttaceae bacterium]